MQGTIRAYHGSGCQIERFDYEFTDIGNDQLGSGFYFTTSESEAAGYCTNRLNGNPKPGCSMRPTLHKVTLNLKNPMPADHMIDFHRQDIEAIIRQSPILDQQLENWGEVEFSGRDTLIREAVETYVGSDGHTGPIEAIKIFNMLSTDFYPGHQRLFFEVLQKRYGFDGVVMSYDRHKHYVAWFSESIKIDDRIDLAMEAVKMNVGANWSHEMAPDIFIDQFIFHGTSESSARDIFYGGIDLTKTTKGYFGNGFYCTFEPGLAVSNYADMNGSDDDPGSVVVACIKDSSGILDLRNPEHWERYRPFSNQVGMDGFESLMSRNGIKGLYDNSFGLVIYDPEAVDVIAVLPAQEVKGSIQAPKSARKAAP
jgi:hypothetical protein